MKRIIRKNKGQIEKRRVSEWKEKESLPEIEDLGVSFQNSQIEFKVVRNGSL